MWKCTNSHRQSWLPSELLLWRILTDCWSTSTSEDKMVEPPWSHRVYLVTNQGNYTSNKNVCFFWREKSLSGRRVKTILYLFLKNRIAYSYIDLSSLSQPSSSQDSQSSLFVSLHATAHRCGFHSGNQYICRMPPVLVQSTASFIKLHKSIIIWNALLFPCQRSRSFPTRKHFVRALEPCTTHAGERKSPSLGQKSICITSIRKWMLYNGSIRKWML